MKFIQSCIDVALWILVQDDDEEFDHNRVPLGFLLTYVYDSLVEGAECDRGGDFEDFEDKSNRRY